MSTRLTCGVVTIGLPTSRSNTIFHLRDTFHNLEDTAHDERGWLVMMLHMRSEETMLLLSFHIILREAHHTKQASI